jgi:hypothetical protein
MRRSPWTTALLVSLNLARPSGAQRTFANHTAADLPQNIFSLYEDRPDGCPPCFNCNLEDFQCHQFAKCIQGNGKCDCQPGFGGDDCSTPLCGALPDGNRNRAPRSGDSCECSEGWGGINCNVCETNQACNALIPGGEGGVCFKDGQLVKENYQMCDITNKKILDQLKDKKPQATFSCNAEKEECNFQCMPPSATSISCAPANMPSSLGCPTRVLLLRPRYLLRQLRRRRKPKRVHLQLREYPVRLRTRSDAVWRSWLR